ncbi:MAG: TonB-dependent receptor plug domain-containing protein, partial [Flavisolibacter sp.]
MKKIIFLLTMTLFSLLTFAQTNVTVKVVDAQTGNTLSHASVKLKNSPKGGITNAEGVYKIEASANSELEISSVGYATITISLKGESEIVVRLEAATLDLSDVVIVGTRGAARAKLETPVPVDVIKINQAGMPTAKMDIASVLNITAPSFNYNKQTGADGADHIDLGTLRGLGPDQTLVMINGKRRHQTAFVALFGTRGRGNSGVDLNAFPESAVDRIEILRDGASAQYGSDAMAGVINVILKKNVNHWSISTGWSGYYDNKYNSKNFNAGNQYYSGNAIDGGTYTLSVNNGVAIGKHGGFINVSADFLTQGKTYRQADTTNWQTEKNAVPYINTSRRAFGDASLTTAGIMYNMEIPAAANYGISFYSFGGYNYKASDAFAYTRNYSGRPERFPATPDGTLINVPDILRTANDGEIYYNPHIQTHVQDASLALGIRKTTRTDWNLDLSNTLGRNDFHFFGDKTFNASRIGQSSPNHYDDGGFNFLQNTVNLDISKSFKTIAHGMNLGFGAEYRYERYEIYKGEEGSYHNYHPDEIIYQNLVGDGSFDSLRAPASGSQGFPGFSPSDVVTDNRSNVGIYVDAELNATRQWLLDGAIRFENYSDFGSVAT